MEEKEELQQQLNYLKQYAYDYATTYGNLFVDGLFTSGIIRDVTPEQLQEYFANPEQFQDVIYDIANYFYIMNAEIHQLFEMIESLPRLNYKINAFERDGTQDKNILKLKRNLHRINHKQLTRDILKQTASYGNVLGVWLGKGEDTYPFIFSDMRCVQYAYRTFNGKWQVVVDASYFYKWEFWERESLFREFEPLLSREERNLLWKGELLSFKLPIERTIFTGTGKLNRNQFVGTSWITPVMIDVLHKRKLKDVEQTVANKIINAVAVLTIGSFDGKEKDNEGNLVRDYNNIPSAIVKQTHAKVKQVLEEGSKNGMSLVTLPNFANIVFPKLDADALDDGKFVQTNSDITKGLGISSTAMNGEGANYNSAKLNLEIFYTKLAVMLEDVDRIYGDFFNLVLPVKYKNNYIMEYSKDMPLPVKDRIQHLKGLYEKGWSARTYIEELGYDFDLMWAETQEENAINLNRSLVPPPTSYTTSGDEIMGRPTTSDDSASENTIRTRETQGN